MKASIAAGNHNNLVRILGKISNHPTGIQGLVLELIPGNYKNLGNPPNFETYQETLILPIYPFLFMMQCEYLSVSLLR